MDILKSDALKGYEDDEVREFVDNIKNILPRYLDEMKDKNISFTEMLYDLTREEIKYQT